VEYVDDDIIQQMDDMEDEFDDGESDDFRTMKESDIADED